MIEQGCLKNVFMKRLNSKINVSSKKNKTFLDHMTAKGPKGGMRKSIWRHYEDGCLNDICAKIPKWMTEASNIVLKHLLKKLNFT